MGFPIIAALDVGSRRIGVAVSDDAGVLAHPLCTLDKHSLDADFSALRRSFGSRNIACIIVGLPVNMDGTEGPMVRHVRNFAAKLAGALQIPVEFQDERLSSFEAKQRLAGSTKRGGRKGAVDAVAAAVILETWLESNRHSR